MPDLTGGGGRVRGWRTHLESLSIGLARREALAAAVSDFLVPLSQVLGVKLLRIVGYNFLRHFRVTVDYPAQILAFD